MPKRSRRRAVLSPKQRQLLAEIIGNFSVGWFTVGVISPIFIASASPLKTILSIGSGVILTVIFIVIALIVIKQGKTPK